MYAGITVPRRGSVILQSRIHSSAFKTLTVRLRDVSHCADCGCLRRWQRLKGLWPKQFPELYQNIDRDLCAAFPLVSFLLTLERSGQEHSVLIFNLSNPGLGWHKHNLPLSLEVELSSSSLMQPEHPWLGHPWNVGYFGNSSLRLCLWH